MIGIIPAAGKSKRFGEFKPLFKVNGKYLIEYPLQNIIDCGITEAIIIQDDERRIENTIGYNYNGLNLKYIIQKERLGISNAILLTKNLVKKQDMLIIFADILYKGNDLILLDNVFELFKRDCIFAVKKVKDKNLIKKSYGITNSNPYQIIEKPQDVSILEPFLGLGIYFVSNKFFNYIAKTKPSKRTGEIEITDTLDLIPRKKINYFILNGLYANLNTKEDLTKCMEELEYET